MAYQRPGSEVSLANSERDYENVIPPHLLRWPQQIPEQTRTARPDVSILTTFTDNTRCSSRKIPIGFLYILACAALLIAISAFVLAFLKFIPRCPEGWPKFQTTCYYFSSNQHTWEEAQSVCFTLGAHLVVVHDNATEKFLNHQQNSSYWLGLRRYAKGHWLWVDDTPVQDTFIWILVLWTGFSFVFLCLSLVVLYCDYWLLLKDFGMAENLLLCLPSALVNSHNYSCTI
ncbi:C-type lectin domain family 2 member F-like isoform X2 [Sceloporus undulatus]|uniref:C-type lectin domain family 2 member F-like isoform X2 n=1 Tax=Sceloporus undulatus TaxID=8520 RepID=UPI001C4D454A|nr:C-type lectin domain family 2 member F-like isoform X2 [Sceloporus undulatus]